MADDSFEILEVHPFHPTDPPYGMRNYDVGCLSAEQKLILNKVKMSQRRQNEIYLSAHPEIRGLISILLRYVLRKKPRENVHETVGEFFNRPRFKLASDLLKYLEAAGHSIPLTNVLRKEFFKEDSSSNEMSDFQDSAQTSQSNVT
ncbi:uncharacterized protein LOC111674385 [Orussus abietinus]|uniref:uncharacterized protein LOC111674385 n=1 Tax=Orussus abietinus TaxID=222816 RepID=UPI000C716315|nr:uncharacterized protein LOC111674385 [Orussus abietinus]